MVQAAAELTTELYFFLKKIIWKSISSKPVSVHSNETTFFYYVQVILGRY